MSGTGPSQELGDLLGGLADRYGGLEFIQSDPLQAVYAFDMPEDQEVVGFIAAALSFGNVKAIQGAIEVALRPLGAQPASALRSSGAKEARRWSRGFRYRWIHDVDMAALYGALGQALRDAGSLEGLFAPGMSPGDTTVLGGALALIEGLRSRMDEASRGRRACRFLLADPGGAGASKRLHMFLRWMIRDEAPDLGLWRSARPDQLLMPLDTHVARIARYVGLTDRHQADRRTCEEVTEALRLYSPEDPTRYDFALARLGILGHCPHRRDAKQCGACDLFTVCRLQRRGGRFITRTP